MSRLASLIGLDLRAVLPRRLWSIGWRPGPPRGMVLHYNGPAVKDRSRDGELRQLHVDAAWQMRPGGLGVASGGDGLQYHLVILGDGTVALTRDMGARLWHCGNAEGNDWSLAAHLPLGGTQDATEAQWASFGAVCDAVIADFALVDGRNAVKGHRELSSSTLCPGPILMRRLQLWRGAVAPIVYRCTVDVANVRGGPGTAYPVVGKLRRDETVTVGSIVIGSVVAGNERWCALDGKRFVHASLLVQL